MDQNLPCHPRALSDLRILRRGPDEIQVGLDPRVAVVLSGLPEPVASALHRLDGRQRTEELVAGLGEHGPAMHAALTALAGRGMLDDASRQGLPLPARLAGDVFVSALRAAEEPGGPYGGRDDPGARRGLAVAVHGDGRLAVSVACLLAGAGVGWVHVVADGRVRPADTGTGYLPQDVGRLRRAVAKEAVARVDAGVRTTSFRPDRGPDLVVLADTLVHEPSGATVPGSPGVPHLSVRMRDGTGIVGPFVVPGRTSCLRCADLHRCDLDEHWPLVAVQLAGQVQLADLVNTQATAAFAVGQVLEGARWLKGAAGPPESCEATLELDVRAATVRRRSWAAHPRCPCGAHRAAPMLLRTTTPS